MSQSCNMLCPGLGGLLRCWKQYTQLKKELNLEATSMDLQPENEEPFLGALPTVVRPPRCFYCLARCRSDTEVISSGVGTILSGALACGAQGGS